MEHEHKIDRISELPDLLLQHILCFLPIKKVVESCLFSKRWKHVWFKIPVLEFDQTFFEYPAGPENPTRKIRKKRGKKRTKLYNRVNQILLSHRSQGLKINKFTLVMKLSKPKLVSRAERWIDYVVKSDVEELNLDFYQSDWKSYPLPQSVVLAKSLTLLSLSGCRLESPSLSCDHINLPSLKKLSLFKVHTDDQIIHNIVSGCPLIEDMSVTYCYGLKSIHFSGLPKLMTIQFHSNCGLQNVELEASNLYSANIRQGFECKFNLVPCKNLKKLELVGQWITDEWLRYHISELPLIEDLTLMGCLKLERIKISSHRLKELYLFQCRNLVEVEIDAPKLCNFSYSGRRGLSFSLNALAYLSQAIYQMPNETINIWDVESLAKLSNSKLLYLSSFCADKDVVIPKELRETVPSPSPNVKQLKVEMSMAFIGHEIAKLVDNLLWIAPLPEVLIILYEFDDDKPMDSISFKFSYKKPILIEENPSCCKLLPVPCWRHCLKTVTIENIRYSADEETLKVEKETLEKYFYENAKCLESFQFLCGGVS